MWQYVEFTIIFSLGIIAFLFRNLKKPAFHLFTEDVKPNSYGYYQVEDMLMPKEEWIKYCNEEESDRNILEEGLYLLSFLGFLIFLALKLLPN